MISYGGGMEEDLFFDRGFLGDKARLLQLMAPSVALIWGL